MRLVLSAEQEVLLASIKANNDWGIFVPEEMFYQTLHEILQNTEDDYQEIMEDLIDTLKRYPYQEIRRVVSKL